MRYFCVIECYWKCPDCINHKIIVCTKANSIYASSAFEELSSSENDLFLSEKNDFKNWEAKRTQPSSRPQKITNRKLYQESRFNPPFYRTPLRWQKQILFSIIKNPQTVISGFVLLPETKNFVRELMQNAEYHNKYKVRSSDNHAGMYLGTRSMMWPAVVAHTICTIFLQGSNGGCVWWRFSE